MQSHKNRTRHRFELEALEGRVALSHMGAVVEDGTHHNRDGHASEIQSLRQGADDLANHDTNDDKVAKVETVHKDGGTEAVHRHQGGKSAVAHVRRHGVEHPAGHK